MVHMYLDSPQNKLEQVIPDDNILNTIYTDYINTTKKIYSCFAIVKDNNVIYSDESIGEFLGIGNLQSKKISDIYTQLMMSTEQIASIQSWHMQSEFDEKIIAIGEESKSNKLKNKSIND